MNILIIGGTRFVGRHMVESALADGHQVTLLNRGKSNPGIYPDVTEIHTDRDSDLDMLDGKQWDVVFDICGYVPRVVKKSAEKLRDAVGRYVFVSSISVYSDMVNQTSEDDSPLCTLDDPTDEQISGGRYGGLKALCEEVVSEIYGDRSLIVRPGFIVGRYDSAARLPYLLSRFQRGGDRLTGTPDQPVQMIHARDLADWMLAATVQNLTGNYNLTGESIPMQMILDAINSQVDAENTITYTTDEFLQSHDVVPVDGLTYWVPEDQVGIMRVTIEKARKTGLRLRSVDEIVNDVLAYPSKLATEGNPILLTPERETELLAAWHNKA